MRARRRREVNAHLLLEGQPRVVGMLHTFCGTMSVARLVKGRAASETEAVAETELQAVPVLGMVEEYCNQSSLHNFMWRLNHPPTTSTAVTALEQQRQQLEHRRRRGTVWHLEHLASEFAGLMQQVGAKRRMAGLPPASCLLP